MEKEPTGERKINPEKLPRGVEVPLEKFTESESSGVLSDKELAKGAQENELERETGERWSYKPIILELAKVFETKEPGKSEDIYLRDANARFAELWDAAYQLHIRGGVPDFQEMKEAGASDKSIEQLRDVLKKYHPVRE